MFVMFVQYVKYAIDFCDSLSVTTHALCLELDILGGITELSRPGFSKTLVLV